MGRVWSFSLMILSPRFDRVFHDPILAEGEVWQREKRYGERPNSLSVLPRVREALTFRILEGRTAFEELREFACCTWPDSPAFTCRIWLNNLAPEKISALCRFLFFPRSCDTGRFKVFAQHFYAQQLTANAESRRYVKISQNVLRGTL